MAKGESPESVNDFDLEVDLTYTRRSRLAHTSEGVREASDGFTAVPCDRTDTGAFSVQTLPTGIDSAEVQWTLDESVITSEGLESSLPCNRGSFPSPSMPLVTVHSVEKVPKV